MTAVEWCRFFCECGNGGGKIGPEERAVGPQAVFSELRAVPNRGPRGLVFVRGVVMGGEAIG